MSYVKDMLLENETVVYQEQQHWVIFLPVALYVLVAIVFFSNVLFEDISQPISGFTLNDWIGFVFLFMAAVQALVAYASYVTSEFAITNLRILMRAGWFRRMSVELFLSKVETVLVVQTLTGRLLGYGKVVVVGTGGSRDPFLYINQPLQFRQIVQQQMQRYNRTVSS